MDDVLSALDTHTARWVVERCLAGSLMKNRTVILVTHNVTLVRPLASFIVELDAGGTVIRSEAIEEGEYLTKDKGKAPVLVPEVTDTATALELDKLSREVV